jgi:hypothetical protein
MKKAQTNLIIILGMAVATFWALMNTFSYTSTVGGSTNIRGRVVTTITTSESARLLFDQERRYALDRAILFTGLTGGGDPIVTLNYGDCDGSTCLCPTGYSIYNNQCGNPDLQACECYIGGCQIPESERYIDIAEFLPFLPVPDFVATVDGKTVVRYWKNQGDYCIPSQEDIVGSVDTLLGEYLAFSSGAALAPSGTLQSETYITFTRDGIVYKNIGFSRPYLKHIYDVTYNHIDGGVEFDPTDDLNLEPVYTTIGQTVILENIEFELRSINRTRLELTGEYDVPGYNFSVCIETGGKYMGVFSYKNGSSPFFKFDISQSDDDCYIGAPAIKYPSVGSGDEIQIGTAQYHVFIDPFGSITGLSLSLEPSMVKVMEIGKDWIYYDIRNDKFEFATTRIGEINTDQGEIAYTFIPSEEEKLSMNISAGRFNITNTLSLLSSVGYTGGFPDLYSYAKDYVGGEYQGRYDVYRGWQEYELEHRIDYILDAVTMKTLQVFVKAGEELTYGCSSGDRCESSLCIRDPTNCAPEDIQEDDGKYYCGTDSYDSCTYSPATCTGTTCEAGLCNRFSYSYLFGGCPIPYAYSCSGDPGNPTCIDGFDILMYDFCTVGKVPRCTGNRIDCYSVDSANCAVGTLQSGTCQCVDNSCEGIEVGCECYPTASCPSGYTMVHLGERTIDSVTYPDGYYCRRDTACNMRTVDQDKITLDPDTCWCSANEDLILPKQDWLTRLIWNMGLEETGYTYDDLECAQFDLDNVEVFNCGLCPNEECETIFDQALKTEFMREFEQISPAKLEALTGYPWRITVKDLYVEVKDLCTGESREVSHTMDYSFDETGRSQAAGLPIQLIFAENSSLELESPYTCDVCKNLQTIGSMCISGVSEDACDCDVVNLPVFGDVQMDCNANNLCCPPDHVETLRGNQGEIISPCCKIVDLGTCTKYQSATQHTYECYDFGATTTNSITVSEECAATYGAYGRMVEVN